MKRIISFYFLLISLTLLLIPAAFIQLNGQSTNLWTGTTSVNWGTSTNWSLGRVPLNTDLVVIQNSVSGSNDNPTVNVAAVCAALTLEQGNQPITLTISGTNSLTVSGAVTINQPTDNNENKIIAVGAGSLSCASVTMASTGSNTSDCRLTISTGTVTVTGTISMGGNADRNQVSFSAAGTLNIGGSITGGNLVTFAGSKVNYNGSVVQIVRAVNYSTLKCNNRIAGVFTEAPITASTLTIGDDTVNSFLEIRWAFICTGTLNLVSGTFKLGYASTPMSWPGFTTHNISAGTTVEYGATAAQTVSANPPYANLKVSGSSTKTPSNNLTINGDLIIESGSLDLLAYTANHTGSGGTLMIADGATLLVKGASNYPSNYETHALGLASTVNYAMANAQNVAVDSYGNLTLSGGNTKSFGGATDIRGTLSIASGTIANLGSSPANSNCIILKLAGVNQVAGTYGSTASNATYKNAAYFGTTATAILNVEDAISWLGTTNTDWFTGTNWSGGNIPTASTNVIIPAAGNPPSIGTTGAVCRNITIYSGSSLTIQGANSLTLYGNWFKPDGVPFYANTSTVIFAGANDNIIEGWTVFYNLTIDKDASTAKVTDLDIVWPKTSFEVTNNLTLITGIIELNGSDWDYFIGNDVTIELNGTITCNHWFPLHVKGDWTNNGGSCIPGNSLIMFDGNGTQTISGSGTTTFYDLLLQGNTIELNSDTEININGMVTVNPGTLFKIKAAGRMAINID
jgi:hypothetical protein